MFVAVCMRNSAVKDQRVNEKDLHCWIWLCIFLLVRFILLIDLD